MPQYRKKPVVIEAFLLKDPDTDSEWPNWFEAAMDDGTVRVFDESTLHIQTLEGVMTAKVGEWIIRGVKGEIYPCKPDIFAATYEAV